MQAKTENPIIVVCRPHQRPAFATLFDSKESFVRSWVNGGYGGVFADNADKWLDEAGGDADLSSDAAFDAACEDVGHDLHGLTILESAADVAEHLSSHGHNMGYSAVALEARRIGWI